MADPNVKYACLLDKNVETIDKTLDIGTAVSFICQKLNVLDANSLDCKIKVTDTFVEEYRRIHFKPDVVDSNGITIPPLFQSSEYKQRVAGNPYFEGKTVVLINNKRLGKVSSQFYVSVIIHELSHCVDYVLKLPEFQKKYKIE